MAFNRYDPLPGITSPRPDKSQNYQEPLMQPVPMLVPAKMPLDVQRMQAIELRVAALEHSNKMLLDELVSTKNESKGAIRRVESTVSEELVNQRNISENFRSNADFVSQLSIRVKRNEEQIQSGQNSLNGVIDQIRRLNQMITNGQTSAAGRSDNLDNRLMELHSSFEEGRTERQQVLTLTAALGDKIKSLEQRVDSKLNDLSSLSLDIKKRSLLIEDDTRSVIDQFKKAQEYQNELDHSNHQMKAQFDARIAEFQAVVNDLRNRNLKEETEKRNSEQFLSRKVNDLQFALSDLQRSFSDVQQESSRLKQEMTSLYENENSKLNEQVNRLADEFRRKLHDSETKMKEESTRRIAQMEKSISDEKENRQHSEKLLKNELKDDLTELKDKFRDEFNVLKKSRKAEKQKVTDSLNVINDGLLSVEKHQDEWFEKLTKSLRAEIKTRENISDNVDKQISDMDKKFAEALTLVEEKVTTQIKSGKGQTQSVVKTPPDMAARQESVNELETNVKALAEKITQLQTSLEKKMNEAAMLRNSISSISMNKASETESVNEALKEVIDWYKKSTNQVAEVNKLFLEKVAPRLDDVEKELDKVKEVTVAKIFAEKSERLTEYQKLQQAMVDHVNKLDEEQKTEFKSFAEKMKEESELLANAIMKITQSIRQTIDDEIYRISQQVDDDKKKKTDQIMQVRQEVNELISVVQANLIMVNDYKSQVNRTFFGTSRPVFEAQHFPPTPDKRSRSRTKFAHDPKQKTSETQTANEIFTQTDPERVAPKGPIEESLFRNSSKKFQTLETGTALQTLESYLAGITLTAGRPTLGTQTGESLFREPPSPGFGVQTSFRSSPEGGVHTQTSQVFGSTRSKTYFSDPNRRQSLPNPDSETILNPEESQNENNPESTENQRRSGSYLDRIKTESANQDPAKPQSKQDPAKPKSSLSQKPDQGGVGSSGTNPGDSDNGQNQAGTENQGPSDAVPPSTSNGNPQKNGETKPNPGKNTASREPSNVSVNKTTREPNADELHYTSQSRRSKTKSLPIDDQDTEL